MRTLVVFYSAVKFNKSDVQYKAVSDLPTNHWLTERVKVEAYQGFSKAYNLSEYFRTRGTTSWKSGESVTGLWRMDEPNIFYGDRKSQKGKTLILFFRSPNKESLKVVCFPDGFYPSKNQIKNQIERFR